jgi:hypothetical protein
MTNDRIGQVWQMTWGTVIIVTGPYSKEEIWHPVIFVFPDSANAWYVTEDVESPLRWEDIVTMKRLA